MFPHRSPCPCPSEAVKTTRRQSSCSISGGSWTRPSAAICSRWRGGWPTESRNRIGRPERTCDRKSATTGQRCDQEPIDRHGDAPEFATTRPRTPQENQKTLPSQFGQNCDIKKAGNRLAGTIPARPRPAAARGRIQFIATVIRQAAAANGADREQAPKRIRMRPPDQSGRIFHALESRSGRSDQKYDLSQRDSATASAARSEHATASWPRPVNDAIRNRSTATEALQNSQ